MPAMLQVWLQLEMHLQPFEKRTRKLLRQLDAESAGGQVPPQLLEAEYAANLDQLLADEGSGPEDQQGSEDSDEDKGEQGLDGHEDCEDQGLSEDAEEADEVLKSGKGEGLSYIRPDQKQRELLRLIVSSICYCIPVQLVAQPRLLLMSCPGICVTLKSVRV